MSRIVRLALMLFSLWMLSASAFAAPIALGPPVLVGQINLHVNGDYNTYARLIDFGSTSLAADIGNPLGSLLITPFFFGGTADGNTGNGFGGDLVRGTATSILYLQQYQKTSESDVVQFHTVGMDVMVADLSAKNGEFVSAAATADVSAFTSDPTTDMTLLLGEGNVGRVRASVSGNFKNWTWTVSSRGTSTGVTQEVDPGNNEYALSVGDFTFDVPLTDVAVGETMWVLYNMVLIAAPGEFETWASARLLDPPTGAGVTFTATDAAQSPVPVPEPGTAVLLVTGLVASARLRARARMS